MKEFCQSLQKVRGASGDSDQDLSRCAPLKWTVLTLLPCLIHTPPRMTLGKPRSTRKLRTWVIEQVESGNFPGVCWDDASKTMFRIPWKHAGKQDFREDQDAAFFKVSAREHPCLLDKG